MAWGLGARAAKECWPIRQEVSQNGQMANLEKHYHELWGLTEGWTVRKMELELAKQRVEIDVE